MSPTAPADLGPHASSGAKNKKNKKKKAGSKAKANGDSVNGNSRDDAAHSENVDGVQQTVDESDPKPPTPHDSGAESSDCEAGEEHAQALSQRHNSVPDGKVGSLSNGLQSTKLEDAAPSAPDERFSALVRDRDTLRAEVTELRKALEEIQSKHQGELEAVQERLDETNVEKEHAETQYRNLLGKVNTIKSQLGERLKADAEELAQARTHIEDLEQQNEGLQKQNAAKAAELAALAEEGEQRSKELSSLRNRTNLSQQNWVKEKQELMELEANAREEFEAARQAMHDWEVLALEERSIRENLGEKVTDLEEQVANYKEAHDKAAMERDNQSVTVDGLQMALQEVQTARKQELRELVESSQAQVEELRNQLQDAESVARESQGELERVKKELERALPFEKEVKEKNLLIGKLRHEAVILNDHLTKALRFLKRGKPEDNVDRHIVTNHFLHFLALDRSDPKKFQVLQLIAALLGWTDEQREQAGLARPGTSSNAGSLRSPISPFHRTPSTPALSADYFPENPSGASKESLAEMWSNFLEQEAQAGSKGKRSRQGSTTESAKPT